MTSTKIEGWLESNLRYVAKAKLTRLHDNELATLHALARAKCITLGRTVPAETDCSADDRDALMADAADVENPELSIDLETQTIRRPNGVEVSFEIDPFRKQCLLEGLDDIGLTLEKGGSIDSFEATRAEEKPWL